LSWRRAATGSRDSFLVADRADPDSCAEVAVVVRACVRQLPVGDKDGAAVGDKDVDAVVSAMAEGRRRGDPVLGHRGCGLRK
jgi:hypothetical protein